MKTYARDEICQYSSLHEICTVSSPTLNIVSKESIARTAKQSLLRRPSPSFQRRAKSKPDRWSRLRRHCSRPSRSKEKSMLKLSDYENEEPARKCAKPSLVSKRTKSKSATTARVRRASSSCSTTKTKKHRSRRAPPNLRTRQAKEATPDDPDADKELRAMMDIDDGKK